MNVSWRESGVTINSALTRSVGVAEIDRSLGSVKWRWILPTAFGGAVLLGKQVLNLLGPGSLMAFSLGSLSGGGVDWGWLQPWDSPLWTIGFVPGPEPFDFVTFTPPITELFGITFHACRYHEEP
jgi:hypothetical protein